MLCQNTRNRSGIVIDDGDHRQYKYKIDGIGRISFRNRVHLCPLLVIKPHLPLGTLPDRDAELPIPQNEVQLSVPPVNNSGGILPRRSSRRRHSPNRYGEWTS